MKQFLISGRIANGKRGVVRVELREAKLRGRMATKTISRYEP